MRLPTEDSATGRGIKTAAQAIVGFCIGLVVVVWNVPGVPDAIVDYTKNHLWEILLLVGVPAGITSTVWNLFRPSVRNY